MMRMLPGVAPGPGPQQSAEAVLRKVWKHQYLRADQNAAIDAVLAGKDVLVVMATGAGKSMCYQIPPILMAKAVLVVSPLISIMQDQVEGLRRRGLSACLLGSAAAPAAIEEALRGDFQYVYVTPEYVTHRFDVIAGLHSARAFGLLAVDEAHCIADWGRGFRKDFTTLHRLRAAGSPLAGVPLIAVTATASLAVQAEILSVLRMQHAVVLRSSSERPTLHIACKLKPAEDAHVGSNLIACLLTGAPCSLTPFASPAAQRGPQPAGTISPAVIYCVSKAQVHEMVAVLSARPGFAGKVAAYTADQSNSDKVAVQDAFYRGSLSVVFATTAFGMGIDKRDIRWVIHWGLPQSIQIYYQMIGRAGRDLNQADCLLLWSPSDVSKRQFLHRTDAQNGVGESNRQASEFSKLTSLVQAPRGCRHGSLVAEFDGEPGTAASSADRLGPCQGGCDVCDLRLAALRDLSAPARVALGALQAAAPRRLSIDELVEASVAAGNGAGLQHVGAYWRSFARMLESHGLISTRSVFCDVTEVDVELAAVTAEGQRELDALREALPQATCASAVAHAAARKAPAPVTSSMRCTFEFLTAEAANLTPAQKEGLLAHVAAGRANVTKLLVHLGLAGDEGLPRDFVRLLPCALAVAGVTDFTPAALKQHGVDSALWKHLRPFFLQQARASGPHLHAVVASAEFQIAEREWIKWGAAMSASVRSKVLSQEQALRNARQAQANATRAGITTLQVLLTKLSRRLQAQHVAARQTPACGEADVLSTIEASDIMPAAAKQAIVEAVPLTLAELAASSGLKPAVIQLFGDQMLAEVHAACRAHPTLLPEGRVCPPVAQVRQDAVAAPANAAARASTAQQAGAAQPKAAAVAAKPLQWQAAAQLAQPSLQHTSSALSAGAPHVLSRPTPPAQQTLAAPAAVAGAVFAPACAEHGRAQSACCSGSGSKQVDAPAADKYRGGCVSTALRDANNGSAGWQQPSAGMSMAQRPQPSEPPTERAPVVAVKSRFKRQRA